MRSALHLSVVLAALAMGAPALADEPGAAGEPEGEAVEVPRSVATPSRPADVPPGASVPARLTLSEAVKLFRTRGLDLLIADTAVMSAQGDLRIARAVTNPTVSVGLGGSLTYSPEYSNSTCTGTSSPPCSGAASSFTWNLNVSDNAAITQALFGKRGLQIRVARWALEAARMDRQDAQRSLEGGVKAQYAQAALAQVSLDYAKEGRDFAAQTFDLVAKKYKAGAVSDADNANAETDMLEQEQAISNASNNLRQAKIALAFLLGSRTPAPEFELEGDFLAHKVSEPVDGEGARDALVRDAIDLRPDLKSIELNRKRAEAAVALARRQRVPDIALWAQYTMEGTGNAAIQPPTLTVGLSAPLPIFYQQQGEILKAQADLRLQDVQRAKHEAQLVNDVESARANLGFAKQRVDRLESRLLKRSGDARDLVKIQYEKGSASLLEMTTAQRQYIAIKQEYLQAQTDYWTAVFALEQAVGRELHR